jgi:phosphoribosylanthranilate isomerase
MNRMHPQIKICGLTDPDEARAVADCGADAIGLVFHPPSPRHVGLDRASEIVAALPGHVAAVGVFVNPAAADLDRAVDACGLRAVQLHGAEPPEFIANVRRRGDLRVIKALFTTRSPGLTDAERYAVDGFLVECGSGKLPGGNAETWNWALAEPFGRSHPLVLAGGLDPVTVGPAIGAALPDAVDASSGLERSPGRKDPAKVDAFIRAVRSTGARYADSGRAIRTIF